MSAPARTLLFLSVLGTACSSDNSLGPPLEPDSEALTNGVPTSTASHVSVLTRNLYVGTDLDAVLTALVSSDPQDDLPALLTGIRTLQETDFPRRAAAFADEIARTRAHIVGLQEVSTIDINLTPLSIPVTLHLDFLPALLTELSERGLQYAVAGLVENIEAAPLPGISLLDRDALLVDASRVEIISTTEATFAHNIGLVAPGVVLKRGWVAATVRIGDEVLTVASTHLETGESPQLDQLRAAQALELVTALGAASPAILMGDLNDVPGSLMHQVVTGAGFADTWSDLRPSVQGFTCCHLPDLSNHVEAFHERIDYVMARGLAGPAGDLLGQVSVIGDQPSSLIPGPVHRIWPSDHAGVLAEILLPSASP
jgi:endonuclease/exonuclease/phosphatase family metal-dependent hydrolase